MIERNTWWFIIQKVSTIWQPGETKIMQNEKMDIWNYCTVVLIEMFSADVNVIQRSIIKILPVIFSISEHTVLSEQTFCFKDVKSRISNPFCTCQSQSVAELQNSPQLKPHRVRDNINVIRSLISKPCIYKFTQLTRSDTSLYCFVAVITWYFVH